MQPEGSGLCPGDPFAAGIARKSRLRAVPQGIVDDAQVRRGGPAPGLRRADLRAAPAGERILRVAWAAADQPGDIEFVALDAGAAGAVVPDRAVAPGPPASSLRSARRQTR